MKNKILFLFTNSRLRNQKPRPPLGQLYLCEAVRRKGYDPVLIDARLEKHWKTKVVAILADCVFVGISTIIGEQLRFSMAVAALIKQTRPDIPVVFGGVFPSMTPETILREPVVDFVSIGEGEETLPELADALNGHRDILSVKSLVFKKGGKIVRTAERPQCDLNVITMPAWDLVDVRQYREVNILSSKGCGHGCNFCYNRIFNHSCFRTRNAESIAVELQWLRDRYNIDYVSFVDDNFFENISHAREVMFVLRDAHGGEIKWESTCRADDFIGFDDDMMRLLVDSGCHELFMGFECASDKQLSSINKNITSDIADKCIAKSVKYGICVRALFMMGLPEETRLDILRTFDMMDRLQNTYGTSVKIPTPGIYTPYPGMPPQFKSGDKHYCEPKTVAEWSSYHHDKANHQWLPDNERAWIENVLWIYRYYSKRNRFMQSHPFFNWILSKDACFRWKKRFFGCAFEWNYVRKREQKIYDRELREFLT